MKSRRVVVTGGAGFIGSNLCDSLLAAGHEVVCLDNFSTGHRHNLGNCESAKNFRLETGDIRKLEDCRRAFEGASIVFHQAALGSVPRSIADPIATHEVNATGFVNVLQAARESRVQRIVYASSSSVYGDSSELPKIEDRIGAPISPYASSKLTNEIYASSFSRCYGLTLVGLRYFNVFGPRQDLNSIYAAVVPKFVNALFSSNAPVVHGNGEQSRDFTYVANVVDANHLAASAELPEASNTVVNIACAARTTLNELLKAITELIAASDPTLSQAQVQYAPPRAGDVPHSFASIERASRLLGYRPRYSLREGLEEYIAWYRNQSNRLT